MGRTGSNDDSLPSHPNRSVDPNARRVPERQIEGLAAQLVVRSKDNSTTLDGIIDPLTDAGTVKGAATIPSTVALGVLGPATFDDTLNARGQVQFAEPGSSFNQSGKKRITFDNTGSAVLRVLNSLAEGVKAVLGNFGVTSGSLTAQSDASWATSSSTASHGGVFNSWVSAADNATNALTTLDLHAHDGFYHLSGTVTATTVEDASAGFVAVHARVLAYVDTGSGYSLLGVVGSVSHTGSGAGTSTADTFNTTLSIPGTPATISIRLIAQVNVETTGLLFEPTGFTGSLTSPSAVTWTKSGGTTLSRRGFFLGAESAQPHLTLEPNTGTHITTATSVEGEMEYDGDAHRILLNDGTAIQALATIDDVNNAVIAGGGSPTASATLTGTVKTDVTEADPLVYTKATIDTQQAAQDADIAAVEADVVTLQTDLGTAQTDIDALEVDVADHEGRIVTLEAAPGGAGITSYDTTALREAATPTDDVFVFDEERGEMYRGNGTGWELVTDRSTETLNVKAYGAVGDKVTDDTRAIQRCLDAARVQYTSTEIPQGLNVYFPPGEYRITSPLIVSVRNGGKIYGAGMGITNLWWYGSGNDHRDRMLPVFAFQDCSRVVVEDIQLEFNALAYAAFVYQSGHAKEKNLTTLVPHSQGFSTHIICRHVAVNNGNPHRLVHCWAIQPIQGSSNAVISRADELSDASPRGERTIGTAVGGTIHRAAGVAWTVDEHVGKYVEHWTAGGTRQVWEIIGNGSDHLETLGWTTLPVDGTFRISLTDEEIDGGPGDWAVESATWPTVTPSGASPAWIADLLINSWFEHTPTGGSRQILTIIDNDAGTFQVAAFTTMPAVGEMFRVCYDFADQNNEHHVFYDVRGNYALLSGLCIGHTQSKGHTGQNLQFNYCGKTLITQRFGSIHVDGLKGGSIYLNDTDWEVGVVYAAGTYVRYDGYLYQQAGASDTSTTPPVGRTYYSTETDGAIIWRLLCFIGSDILSPYRATDIFVAEASDPTSFVNCDLETSPRFFHNTTAVAPIEIRRCRWSSLGGAVHSTDDPYVIITASATTISGCIIADSAPDNLAGVQANGSVEISECVFRSAPSDVEELFNGAGPFLLGHNVISGSTIADARSISDGIVRSWCAREFRTNHSVATVIREIQGALPGHTFSIFVSDDLTTFFPGQYLLRDHEAWVAPRGSTITFAYDTDMAMWVEVERVERPVPADIVSLAAAIADEGASLYQITDVRYHRVINSADLITAVRDARGRHNGPSLTSASGEEPSYDDTSTGQPFIAFAGGEKLRTALNADGLSTLGPNLGFAVVGDPGAYSAVEAFADFSITTHASHLYFGRTTGGFLHAVGGDGAPSFTSSLTVPAGVRVMHARRDQVDASNCRLYVREGSTAEQGSASDQANTPASGAFYLAYGARYHSQQFANALLTKAFLTLDGLTNANAAAVQNIINAWAVAQHGATV